MDAAPEDKADEELIVVACLLHDLGWATTPGFRSNDTRFEVDGATKARSFVQNHTSHTHDHGHGNSKSPADFDRWLQEQHHGDSYWPKPRLQLLWDAIALHTTLSIAAYAHPTIAIIQAGIGADFTGPDTAGGVMTLAEYQEITKAFPSEHFKDNLIGVMCGLCKDKRATVWDNFVGEFGREYGLDGKGGGKEEFRKEWEENRLVTRLVAGLEQLEEYEKGGSNVTEEA